MSFGFLKFALLNTRFGEPVLQQEAQSVLIGTGDQIESRLEFIHGFVEISLLKPEVGMGVRK
jgi:hypothetical protein